MAFSFWFLDFRFWFLVFDFALDFSFLKNMNGDFKFWFLVFSFWFLLFAFKIINKNILDNKIFILKIIKYRISLPKHKNLF